MADMDWKQFFSLTSKNAEKKVMQPVALDKNDEDVKKDIDTKEETFLGVDKEKLKTAAKAYQSVSKGDEPQIYSPDPLIFQPDIYHPGMGPVGQPMEKNQSPLFADRSSIESAKVTNLNNQIGQLQSLLFNGQ